MSDYNNYQLVLDTNRYGYVEERESIPLGKQYLWWAHLRYAAGTSKDTMRSEMRGRGFNDLEIDLILEYLDAYVRTEMGVDPDNSRSEVEETILTRCNKFATKANAEVTYYLATIPQVKSGVVPEAKYRPISDVLVVWQAALLGDWEQGAKLELDYPKPLVERKVLELLLPECATRVAQLATAVVEIDALLNQKKADLDIQFLATYDSVADLKAKLPWLE